MNDFLSNIDIGVFDLDQVLKEGITSVVPDRFKNQAKQQEKKVRNLIRDRNRILSLQGQVSDDTEKALREQLKSLKKDIANAKIEARKKSAERKLRGQTIGGSLQNFATSTAGRATMAVGALAVREIQKTFTAITQQVDETGFGARYLLDQFDEIASKSHDIVRSGERLYNTVDQNFETFLDLRREFGRIDNLSVKAVDNVTQLEDIIGLSSDEAIDLLSTFKGINRQTVEVNTTMLKTFSLLARQEGVAFRDVMQDITDNADFFATYMSQSSEDIGEMIVKSRRLGVSFSSMAQVFDSFSDIESTIEKQARLSIFANRNFDFMSVMENLYTGNVQGAQSGIMRQLRGINQGTFDNPLVKQQLAEGFGVDVPTLNKLYKASQSNLSQQRMIQQDFSEQLKTFNDQFKQMGFGTLRKAFAQYVLNPINNLMKQNITQVQAIFDSIAEVIKIGGDLLVGFGKFLINMRKWTGSSMASLATLATSIAGGVVAMKVASAGISKGVETLLSRFGIESQQLGVLMDIRNILASDLGQSPARTSSAGYGMMSGRSGKAIGVLGGLALAGGAGYAGYREGEASQGGILNSLIGGAVAGGGYGAFSGTPVGILAGAGIGAGIGVGSYLLGTQLGKDKPVKQARGGIFNKRYTGMMDVAEAGKPEAFTPLDVEDGKPTLPTKLADDSIRKLSEAMSKMRFIGEVKMPDGSKKQIEFYNHVMKPSSALNT